MSCSTCAKTKPVYLCGDEIIIAQNVTSTSAYGGIDIYIHDITIDETYRVQTTLQDAVGDTGDAVLDLTALAEGLLQPNHTIEIWVTETDSTDKLTLTVPVGSAVDEVDCLNVPFLRLYDGDNEKDSIDSQVLELENA